MSKANRSLVRRLVVTATVWTLVALIAVALALTTLFRNSVLTALDDRLSATAATLIASAERVEGGGVAPTRPPTDPRFERVFSGRYWQINGIDGDEPGGLLGNSRSLWDEQLDITRNEMAGALSNFGQAVAVDLKGPDREPLRAIMQAVELPGDGGRILVIAAEDRRPADAQVRRFAFVSIGIFLFFGFALAGGVILQVRLGLGPVFAMQEAVAKVREGQSEKVEGDFPVELQPLGDELNSLLDHSREVVERARTHVGNLAHALKTPIAVLMNESGAHQGELSDVVKRQTQTMSEQVDHHLRRARAAAHAKAIGARSDVGGVLDDLTRTLQKIYGRNGITLTSNVAPGLVFRGERQDLEEMAGNLCDNACKWAVSKVKVSADLSSDQTIEIIIEDDGPGMSDEQRQLALKRGVRLDEEAPGSGLGLSIVVDLARVYGGELSLSRSALGGLAAALTLPATRR